MLCLGRGGGNWGISFVSGVLGLLLLLRMRIFVRGLLFAGMGSSTRQTHTHTHTMYFTSHLSGIRICSKSTYIALVGNL